MVLAALFLSACAPSLDRRLVVFAASSLSSAFDRLARVYDPPLEISYGASQTLRVQIREGAYADVFASADAIEMERAVAEGLVLPGSPLVFARNRLVVILAPGNPAAIVDATQLDDPGIKLAVADESVPLGRYTRLLFQRLVDAQGLDSGFMDRVAANVVSYELNAAGVAGRVRSGEVDAGIGYASDVTLPGAALAAIPLPDEVSPAAEYLVADLAQSQSPGRARAFALWLLTREAQAILGESGFLSPGVP